MNDQFDELAKGLAQSVTRRQALRRFGVGLAGFALAWLALPQTARADRKLCRCPKPPNYGCPLWDYTCWNNCIIYCGRW